MIGKILYKIYVNREKYWISLLYNMWKKEFILLEKQSTDKIIVCSFNFVFLLRIWNPVCNVHSELNLYYSIVCTIVPPYMVHYSYMSWQLIGLICKCQILKHKYHKYQWFVVNLGWWFNQWHPYYLTTMQYESIKPIDHVQLICHMIEQLIW